MATSNMVAKAVTDRGRRSFPMAWINMEKQPFHFGTLAERKNFSADPDLDALQFGEAIPTPERAPNGRRVGAQSAPNEHRMGS